jgi:hypothetical protein
MDMGMFIAVMVVVVMFLPVGVKMDMFVGLVFYGPPQAPEEIGESETDEQPCGHP